MTDKNESMKNGMLYHRVFTIREDLYIVKNKISVLEEIDHSYKKAILKSY